MLSPPWPFWMASIVMLPVAIAFVAVYLAVTGDRCQFDEA